MKKGTAMLLTLGIIMVSLRVFSAEGVQGGMELSLNAENEVAYGDLNGNGRVELTDANTALRAALSITVLNEEQYLAADVDGVEGIDLRDANYILKCALGIINVFPVQSLEETPEPTQDLQKTPEPTQSLQETPEPTQGLQETPEPTQSLQETPEPTQSLQKTPEPTQDLQETPEPTQSLQKTPEPTQEPPVIEEGNILNMEIVIGDTIFSATLDDNETAMSLRELLPMTLNMNELNGNEKYYYLPQSLPTNSRRPSGIKTGDLMLYGNNCLVLFYESFSTSYSYTPIGHVDNPDGLAAALGAGDVQVTFRMK